jgi:signal transduction histidine kinase
VVFGLLIMSFTVAAEVEGRGSVYGLLGLLGFFLVAMVLGNQGLVAGDVGAAAVLIVLPWLAGRALRERAAHLAAAMSRADRLEQEKQREAEAAVTRERTRLARELHDVVSHSISVIAIQAQAVRRRLGEDRPEEAADLETMELTAREAMAEMRRLFGVLRDDGEDVALAPQPGLGELHRLVERVRDTGLHVEVTRAGEPVELPPGLDLAAYRIIQEALTNALRHSGAGSVAVGLDYRPGMLTVSVEDDGSTGNEPTLDPGTGDGHGLRGIRERTELYGGTLVVAPGTRGGLRVTAALPVGGGAR